METFFCQLNLSIIAWGTMIFVVFFDISCFSLQCTALSLSLDEQSGQRQQEHFFVSVRNHQNVEDMVGPRRNIRSVDSRINLDLNLDLDLSSIQNERAVRSKRESDTNHVPAESVNSSDDDKTKTADSSRNMKDSDNSKDSIASAPGAGGEDNLSKNKTSSKQCAPGNSTSCEDKKDGVSKLKDTLYENSGMLYRAMLVLLGITAIVVIYFVIKAVMLRRRRSKSRKYGIVAQRGRGDMEMEPLGDGDDDDDDFTVFEMNGRGK